jgi:hypothetical protein
MCRYPCPEGEETRFSAVETGTRPLRHFRLSLLVALLATCCAVARGDAGPVDQRDLRQKEIARKTESERARLQRNFKRFRELPVADQEKLRNFHRQLQDDDRENGGLRAVMNEYYDWLTTLPSVQSLDLSLQSDPNAREKRVRELLKEQQDHAEATGAGSRPPRGLSSSDLTAVLGVIERTLYDRKMLSQQESEELKKKQGLGHHVAVIELAFRRGAGGGNLQQPPPWVTPEVISTMVDTLSNPEQRHRLENLKKPDERRWVMFNLLRAGLRAEFEKNKPEQGELERYFVQLKAEKQDEIMRLPFDQQQQKLTQMYLEKMAEENPDKYPRLPRVFFGQQRPAGLRGGGMRGADAARAADADAAQKETNRGKKGKNDKPVGDKAARSKKAVDEPE